jgi:hypothetical protein
MSSTVKIPPRLAEIAGGRDFLKTAEYARTIGITGQSARRHACYETGPVRPIRVGGRLLWPVDQIASVLNGRAK